MNARYWHGGVPGLSPGEQLLPPSVTGFAHPRYDAKIGHKRNLVYIAQDLGMARAFAAVYGTDALRGDVYEVTPVGRLLADPDFRHGTTVSWACREAVVLAVVERDVHMSDSEQVRAIAPWLYWDDGTPQYDSDGYLTHTPMAASQGITEGQLRALGRWRRTDDAVAELLRIRG